MDDPTLPAVLLIFVLMALLTLAARLEKQSRTLRRIEHILATLPGASVELAQGETLEQEVKDLMKKGKLNKAMVLYRKFHDVSLREAEIVIMRAHAAMVRENKTADSNTTSN